MRTLAVALVLVLTGCVTNQTLLRDVCNEQAADLEYAAKKLPNDTTFQLHVLRDAQDLASIGS